VRMKNIFMVILLLVLAFSVSPIIGRDVGLPSREPEKVIPLLFQFNEKLHYDYVESILGEPDKDMGSGIYVLEFRLKDKTIVVVGTPDKKEVWYIYRAGLKINDVFQIYEKVE